MILEIAGGIIIAYLAIFVVAPLVLSLLGSFAEQVIIPVFEGIGKILSQICKICVSAIKWFQGSRWYYKVLIFVVGFIVFGLLSSNYSEFWVCVLMCWGFLSAFYFACWCVDMWRKLYIYLGSKLKH